MSHSRKWKKRRKALREAEARKLADTIETGHHQMSLHHKKCKANGGATNTRNTIMLPIKVHQAWHTITQSHSPEWICDYINDHLLDPDYEFVCIKRE